MKKLLILLFFLLPYTTFANEQDSIEVKTSVIDTILVATPDTTVSDSCTAAKKQLQTTYKNEQFRPKQLILPGLLITAGAWGIKHRWVIKQKERLDDRLYDLNKGKKIKFDDYVQYLPVISYVGLGLLGTKHEHGLTDRLFITATSYLTLALLTNVPKTLVHERRPDSPATNSFPSGHTATAFMGAELVRREYGTAYGVTAYAVASTVAFMRLYNHRHWLNDILAGAGVGFLSANVGYWLMPLNRRLFKTERWGHGRRRRAELVALPSYSPASKTFGTTFCMQF